MSRSVALREGLAAATLAAALTVVVAAPVLWAPTERLFGREIVGRHYTPFLVIAQFETGSARGPFLQPVTDVPGEVLTRWLGSGVLAFNLLILVTFPLAAGFGYLLARHLTDSRAVAWLTALVYAFLPYHLAQAAYHPHGAQIQWLPLYLLALFLCLDRARPLRLALLAVATGLVTLSNFYYGLMAAVLTPVALVAYWLTTRRDDRTAADRGALITLGGLGAVAAGGLGFVAWQAPRVFTAPDLLAFPRRDLFAFSARWWSYWLPPVDHPLAGDRVREIWATRGVGGLLEQQVTVGVGLTALSLIAVVAWLRGERDRLTRPVPVLAAIAAAAFALSLPPDWRLGPLTIPGPSGWIYELLPMFRAYARFALVVALAAAILAGIGLSVLSRRSTAGRAVALALGVLTAVELAPVPPWRWRDVLSTSAHRWLIENVDQPRLFDCMRPQAASRTAAGARFAGDVTYRRGYADCGDPQMAASLADQGFTHMLVRRESALGRWLGEHPAPSGLTGAAELDDALLFAVSVEPPPLSLEPGPGFHWREYKGAETFRWMTDRGVSSLLSRAPEPLTRHLELTLHAFPAPRTVEVLLDGEPIAELEVATEPGPHVVPISALPPGRHELELRSRTPAVIADELLDNGDRRALAVALWGWRWIDPEDAS